MSVIVNGQLRNGQSVTLGGALAGAGSYITWTGTLTDTIAADGGAPYTGLYDDYFGTLAGLAGLFGATTWSNPALTAIGAPYYAVGMGEWANMLATTSVDTIAYSFSAPVPAGASFTLVDPGASYVEWSGSETYYLSATYNGAAVSTSGWSFQVVTPTGAAVASAIAVNAAAGTITVTSYAGATWPDAIVIITPNTPVSSLSVTANTIPFDFWALTLPHLTSALLFQEDNVAPSAAGMIASWQINGTAILGGGTIANPGLPWAYMGATDLFGTGLTDILFRNENGMYAFWGITGTSIVTGGNIAAAGGTWNLAGVADFNGDGTGDMIFEDMTGDLFLWEMHGSTIIGGGSLGVAGAGWRLLAAGDFGGSGAGLLFENASGVYQLRQYSGTTLTATLTLGSAGGWVYAGVADLTGDGVDEILLRDVAIGQYGAWFLSSGGSPSFATLATPGVGSTLVAVGSFTYNAAQDLIFENTTTGALSDYQFASGALTSAGVVGSAGAVWSVERTPYGGPVPPPPTIFFTDSSGDIETWTIPQAAVSATAAYANAHTGWSFLAGANFSGDAEPDILLQTAAGQLGIWQTNGAQVVASATLAAPGGTWKYAGVGDFNGDGLSDILFRDGSNNYSAWLMNGTATIGGGVSLGNPGAGYTLAGIGDLTGDGTSDLVFMSPGGTFEAWFIQNDAFAGSANIGGAGSGWSLAAMGDFNGDGREDILLANTNGTYATWDLNGASVIGGAQFQGPGAGWTCLGADQLFDNRDASIIFKNTGTGALEAYNMNDTSVQSIVSLGTAPSGYSATGLL